MKLFKSLSPKKIKRAIAIVSTSCATLLPASCINGPFPGKTDPEPEPEPEKHHNTTYVWGTEYWDEVWPIDRVNASLDSVAVDTVFLKNDGVSYRALSTTMALRQIMAVINATTPEKRYKIRGAGTLNDLNITRSSATDYRDSIALANLGFKFGRVYYMK